MRRLSNRFTGIEDEEEEEDKEVRGSSLEGSRSQSESDGSPRECYDEHATVSLSVECYKVSTKAMGSKSGK